MRQQVLSALLLICGAIAGGEAELEKRIQDLELRLDELSAKLAKKETGFLSLLKEQFDLGGAVEIEFVDAQSEWNPTTERPSRAESSPYLRVDKIRLSPRVHFTKKTAPVAILLEGDLDFLSDTGRSRVKEFYVELEGFHAEWASSRLRIGLDDRFMRPDYETEFWPLPATAFWRRESLGFHWRTALGRDRDLAGQWTAHASLTDGLELDDREPGEGEEDFVIMSNDSRLGFGEAELREYGFGLGWEKRWIDLKDSPIGRVETELLGFYYNDSMGDDDLAYLGDSFGDLGEGRGVIWTTDEDGDPVVRDIRGRELWGGNGVLRVDDLTFTAHALRGRDGTVRRKAGYLEASWKLRFSQPVLLKEYVRWIEPIVRYEWLDLNLPRVPSNTRTWDRRRWTVAILTEITNNVILKAEYAFNDEKIGGADPKDPSTNELVIQLYLTF